MSRKSNMKINILHMIEGAKQARGIAVIIDVFRAMSVEAYLARNHAEKIIPTADIQYAFDYREKHLDTILCGERGGVIIDGFDIGNSPSDIENRDFSGKVVVHTTSAGTQGIANAVNADEIIGGSLVNASAVAEYIKRKNPKEVSIVCMGVMAKRQTEEDNLAAEYIKSLLLDEPLSDMDDRISHLREVGGAHFFKPEMQSVFPEKDFELCTRVDSIPFVLRYKNDGEESCMERIDVLGIPFNETENEGKIDKCDIKPGTMMSDVSKEDVISFTPQLKGMIAYGNYTEPEGIFDVAVVLGCPDIFMESRAKAAAKLYHNNRCSLFVVSGGMVRESTFGPVLEADSLKAYMMREGVPEELIIKEDKSRSTFDNMTFSRNIIGEKFKSVRPRVAVITSAFHITRTMGLARTFIDNSDVVGVRAEYPGDSLDTFAENSMLREFVAKECRCLKVYVDRGWVKDFSLYNLKALTN